MDKETSKYFADIITLASSVFEQVEYNTDITPERAILQIRGKYGLFQIFITELIDHKMRKYRYYVLKEDRVEAGFDNAPDPRAIRLRYGKIGGEYAGKNIPHLHLNDKTDIELTDEMTFSDFIQWFESKYYL
ncbi:Uncharacterized protein dnl_42250 [Desulfonema limicola]|uniref:Uncharacterized protein n=1 Tax=Desulfonema limicola TaxID=45656 RepID=A0A975BA96_9BACT|nr:hypothetical protein [Desulfonema limicola]QTA81871.1 Uncharacterized protein dnl_42250 [Desulfonema limicola]